MAYGIEEIAEMQVTGPVQGGDMVAKPNEMPVGAAALLNKMQKKNTPGVFKLPSPDKDMPDFMKVAAEGVERETAQGDTINIMAGELMRQGIDTRGMSMDDVIRIYEQTFGSVRDAGEMAEVKPWDWRTILKMIESGMPIEDIEEQMPKPIDNETAALDSIRGDAKKIEALAPEGEQLAYINREEADILKLMGGSGEREPITGIKSFRNAFVAGQNSALGADVSAEFSPREQKQFKAAQDEKAYQTEASGGDVGNYDYTSSTVEKQADRAAQHHERTGQKETIQDYGHKDVLAQIVENQSKKDTATDESSILNFFGLGKLDAIAGGVADWEEEQVRKLLRTLGTEDSATGWGNLLRQMRDQDTGKLSAKGQAWFDKRGDLTDEIYGDTSKDNEWADLNDEEKFQRMVAKMEVGGGSQFEKNFNPNKYYERKDSDKNSADYQKRLIKEGKYDPKEMAQLQREGKLDFTRENTAMIEEGRRRLAQERGGGQDRHPGTGRPTEQVTEEETEVTENITPDERAGSWNLGGTMPHTDDVTTAGVEMNVPLGRRFQIDKDGKYLGGNQRTKEDIYKYATEGGYNQLEPFSNYLSRRMKYLGEQPDEWFDEEGNVIYNNTATA